tara:strand:- start:1064 stop:1243 length:180 start_codon:yes stop_codon:yes gene_type:complete
MIIHQFTFNTEAEAKAFIQGVDFVNDCTIGGPILYPAFGSGKWLVEVRDYDTDGDENDV